MPLGPLMLDLEGLEVSAEEREILQHPLVGGLIFFTRNYREPKQLVELVKQVRDARRDILICVDHEGGRVQRFRDGFSRIPACGKFGEIYEQDKARGISLSKQAGWLMAAELRAYDIDFSFAPVLDLDYGVSAVIGNRAYHSDPDKAFELARAYILGMLEAGMANVGKHYPGHGAVAEDSHLDLPRDRRSLDEIMSRDVVPFRRLNEEGLLNAVMPAHVVYEEVDSQPAGFSKRWISEILRQDLSFDGVVFSDDLDMAAANIVGNFVDRANAALDAGCDMILVCNNRKGAVEVLDGLKRDIDEDSALRLETMRGALGTSPKQLQKQAQWSEAVKALSELL